MRCLADMGVSISTVEALRTHGHDAIHLREENLERLADSAIIRKAARENRVVLTFDLDFGDLMATELSEKPSVIIFRLKNQTPKSVTPRLLQVLENCASELYAGSLIIVDNARLRVRRLPITGH